MGWRKTSGIWEVFWEKLKNTKKNERKRERERERLRENVKCLRKLTQTEGKGRERTHAHTHATDTDPQFPDRATKVAMKTTRATKVAKGIVDTRV